MLSASSIITAKYDYEKSLWIKVNRIYHSSLFKATKYCRSLVVIAPFAPWKNRTILVPFCYCTQSPFRLEPTTKIVTEFATTKNVEKQQAGKTISVRSTRKKKEYRISPITIAKLCWYSVFNKITTKRSRIFVSFSSPSPFSRLLSGVYLSLSLSLTVSHRSLHIIYGGCIAIIVLVIRLVSISSSTQFEGYWLTSLTIISSLASLCSVLVVAVVVQHFILLYCEVILICVVYRWPW